MARQFATLAEAEDAAVQLGTDILARKLTKADILPADTVVSYGLSLLAGGTVSAAVVGYPKGFNIDWIQLALELIKLLGILGAKP